MKSFADPAFPGSMTAFHPNEMIELLGASLKPDHPHLEVKEARILDVKYEPGKEGILLYRFTIKDKKTKIHHKLFFTAALLKEKENPRIPPGWNNLTRFARQTNHLIGKPAFYFRDRNIVLEVFPYDPLMPWLVDMLDEGFLMRRLNQIWSHRNWKVHNLKIEPLGYTPRLRAVFLFHVFVEDKTKGTTTWEKFVAKTSSYKVPEIQFVDLWSLWKSCGQEGGTPRPEGFLCDPPIFLQRWLPGDRLGNKLPGSTNDLLLRTADLIASIHLAKIPLSKMRDPIRETQSLSYWGPILQNMRSDLADRVQTLQSSLLNQIESRIRITGPVHGDFHPTNVLVDGTRVSLIDFDQLAHGDSASDIGRFLASLRIASLRRSEEAHSLTVTSEDFLDTYGKATSIDVSRVRMYESATLIKAAASAFRVQRPEWESEVPLLLEEAERVFQGSKPRQRIRVQRIKKPFLKYKENLQWMMDPVFMQAALALSLKENYGTEIFSCEIAESFHENSCTRNLYKLQGQQTQQPWNGIVEGILFNRPKKRETFNQLLSLYERYVQKQDAFLIPTPITYLSYIKTIVQLPLDGLPFSSLLDHPEPAAIAGKWAKAIVVLHKTEVRCGYKRSLDQIHHDINHDRLQGATALLARVMEQTSKDANREATTIRELTPDHVLWTHDRVGLSRVSKLVSSHPYFDIGKFLAHIRLHGMKKNRQKQADNMCTQLRSAYCNVEQIAERQLALFETLAALVMACSRKCKNYNAQMIDYAHQRFDVAS